MIQAFSMRPLLLGNLSKGENYITTFIHKNNSYNYWNRNKLLINSINKRKNIISEQIVVE